MSHSVSVVARTMPVQIAGVETPEHLLAYVARVSNPNNQSNTATAGRLLAYCLRNKHMSVFESVSLTISVRATRALSRQLLRHRSFTFQEFSQRYAAIQRVPDFQECRMQDTTNRQGSRPCDSDAIGVWWDSAQRDVWNLALAAYDDALGHGIAKEQARALLPEGLTTSHLFMTGTLRSWITYCAVRAFGPGVQAEHRQLALDIWRLVCQEFPVMYTLEPEVRALGEALDLQAGIGST